MAIYVVEIICAVIFSIYRMAYFSHSKDTEFGKSKKAKIIVSTGMFVWALPIVWVPVDILLNNHSGISATFNYYIVMVIEAYQLLFIWFFAPIMFAYYETDVESTCKRIFQALRLQLPLILFLLLATIPTYFLLNEVSIPEAKIKYTNLEPNTTVDGQNYYIAELNFPVHMYVITTWIGLLFVSICGGIGLVFMPYNLLNDWIFRPKPISKSDFIKRQKILLPKLINLRKEGKHLENDRMQVALMTGLTGYLRRYEYNSKMTMWETCTILAEKEF